MLTKKGRNIAYLLVFLASFLAFDRLLFHLLRAKEDERFKKKGILTVFDHRNDFNRNFFSIPRGTYDTVIMGSSRTFRGIHPYYLFQDLKLKAFKIAGSKTRPKFNRFFYDQYKRFAGTPRVLIYGMDYFMFTAKTNRAFFRNVATGRREQKQAGGFSLLLANKAQFDEFLIDILEKFAAADGVEIATGRRTSNTDLPPEAYFIDPFVGYGKKKAIPPGRPPRFETFAYYAYPGVEGAWFFKLLQELQKDGVTVVLVTLPSHIGSYESNFQEDAFVADIRKLIQGMPRVHLLDYDRPEKFPLYKDSFFLDGGYGLSSSHLSDLGSRELHRLLAADLKKCLDEQPASLGAPAARISYR